MLNVLLFAGMMALVYAECPNACSSHGRCGAYDSCICYRNWGSNDCSERICQFGRAHVDTPLGDLDASGGALTGGSANVWATDDVVSEFLVARGSDMYPYGTYEQYPRMEDSDHTVLAQTAHDYRECSNKGLCDRSSGTCECFPGYEGSACQRASCPSSSNGVCSGHGTCKTIQELSLEDHGNVYRLWDEDVTMGCDCDAGYSGPDCSSRVCKYGADPLYYDDFQNVRFANFTLDFYMETAADIAYGNYSIIFTDRHGEDWQTDPIDINAPCSVIQDRLESLPNNVIPTGSVLCSRSQEEQHLVAGQGHNGQTTEDSAPADTVPTGITTDTDLDGYIVAENGMIFDATMLIIARYIIAFPGNPGEIPPLRVNKYLDGARPTLFTTEATTSTLGWHIYPNGYIGEDTDYVNDECEGVLVSIAEGTYQSYLEVSTEQTKLLKACLGDSNGDATDNVDVQDWDWGTWTNPHLIKLVDATQDAYVEYLRADGSSYKLRITQDDQNTADRHEYFVDTAGADYPVTTLCNNGKNYLYTKAGNTNNVFDWYAVSNSGGTDTHDLNVQGDATAGYLGEWGWCKALNPPGFYAVIYYDDCSSAGITLKTGGSNSDDTCDASYPFRVITNAGFHFGTGPDGSTNTKFHVFTTKGTMQQVSQFAAVHTIRDDMSSTDRLASYHSNIVYMHNTTYAEESRDGLPSDTELYGLDGQVDCETTSSVLGAGAGKNGALDCLDYGDKVMFLNLGTHTFGADNDCDTSVDKASSMAGVSYTNAQRLSCNYKPTMASYLSNPPAPNMYTVKKISHDPPSTDTSVTMSEQASGENTGVEEDRSAYYLPMKAYSSYRRRIVLDYGMNANYQFVGTAGEALDADGGQSTGTSAMLNNAATAYKFYPPTLATTGTTGYNYVAECSNRGICDGETGLCNCFAGYAGDNCGLVSSLVK